jgi:hypothetical protein
VPFDPNYCIALKAVSGCPSSYPVGRTYFEAYTDTRACDPCTCDTPKGVTCAGSAQVGGAADCKGPPLQLPLSCANDPKQAGIFIPAAGGLGSCASISHPKGEFKPTTPTTVCCVQ